MQLAQAISPKYKSRKSRVAESIPETCELIASLNHGNAPDENEPTVIEASFEEDNDEPKDVQAPGTFPFAIYSQNLVDSDNDETHLPLNPEDLEDSRNSDNDETHLPLNPEDLEDGQEDFKKPSDKLPSDGGQLPLVEGTDSDVPFDEQEYEQFFAGGGFVCSSVHEANDGTSSEDGEFRLPQQPALDEFDRHELSPEPSEADSEFDDYQALPDYQPDGAAYVPIQRGRPPGGGDPSDDDDDDNWETDEDDDDEHSDGGLPLHNQDRLLQMFSERFAGIRAEVMAGHFQAERFYAFIVRNRRLIAAITKYPKVYKTLRRRADKGLPPITLTFLIRNLQTGEEFEVVDDHFSARDYGNVFRYKVIECWARIRLSDVFQMMDTWHDRVYEGDPPWRSREEDPVVVDLSWDGVSLDKKNDQVLEVMSTRRTDCNRIMSLCKLHFHF